jgi:hypothetical protein
MTAGAEQADAYFRAGRNIRNGDYLNIAGMALKIRAYIAVEDTLNLCAKS